MNVVMMTNTYLPHVGGVAQSVHRFTTSLRARGHRVLVCAPTFDGMDPDLVEEGVVRVPAVQNFSGSDFSVMLPIPLYLTNTLNDFEPDLFHSHHPFLMGDSALRKAATRQIPIVFTHHTLYEEYVHYVPLEADTLREFVKELSTRYANQCDHVIAPSQSVKEILEERGVITPISVIPTGVKLEDFQNGHRERFRDEQNIPQDAFLVGHIGRLAPEKNLGFLSEACAKFLVQQPDAWMLVVGGGDTMEVMRQNFTAAGVMDRVVFTGKLIGQPLVDAYHSMDVFAFSSKSETQGMVIMEAMSASNPVVALDASGVREVVNNEVNGRLIFDEDIDAFVAGLAWIHAQSPEKRADLIQQALRTAEDFSTDSCAARAEETYCLTLEAYHRRAESEFTEWKGILARISKEWELWTNRLAAAKAAIAEEPDPEIETTPSLFP
jgi:1,2-diacylglycerol 3-alpha-glucosyltransferase